MPRANRHLRHHDFPRSFGYPLAHIVGTIEHVFGSVVNHHGADHQHFRVKIDRVIEFKGGDQNLTGQVVFCAVRSGDSEGLGGEIPGLAVGQSIEMQGEYIDEREAYPLPDNSNPVYPVLHFTHHPVGFIRYQNEFYS
jgi:hypothetical protein